MPNTATLFRLLSEFIVLLLGALMILLALTKSVGLPDRPIALVVLGIVLIYWGARILMRPEREAIRVQTRIRAGSLVLVGLLVLAIRFLPLRDAEVLLVVAGAVLAIRGLAGAVLLARKSGDV